MLQLNQAKILVHIFGFNKTMIALNRLNGTKYYLNADLIVSVEGTPDTVITLTNGIKFIVRNRPEDVIQMIIQYQQLVHNPEIQVTRGE
jgi:flagellar protein FlbD